ncbi:polysaccharide pyruvyl transferase family protein [Leeuwenhoekiella palythoae]|uniref:polysaccharide pyruvyl transferase family protein n=1 Tax=Leeuwenhoekiella TaxID=283735 RepID=UPI0014305E15|nr:MULTISPECIES: polysaccharide pyruvyl transferase family protein [Leeuwenhoekiella]UBZ11058.1 polysaccharide pyruvyl transferase family protein [Leeuwenhoekiella palythoae]
MKKEIIVFGPFDRFNYGDLLFPYMIEYAFNKVSNRNDLEFKKYSLVKADLRDKGGVLSGNFKEMYEEINQAQISNVIVAGGECLAARWDNLYSYISPRYNFFRQYDLFRKLFRRIPIAMKLMGSEREFPYVLDSTIFTNQVNIFYNSVGGASPNLEVINRLKKSTYVAVRETYSYDILRKHQVECRLVPDSAIIMSDVYNNEKFFAENVVRKHLKNLGNYVFLQVSKYKHENAIDDIVAQIKHLSKVKSLSIVLCPIGTAGGHEDHIPLKEIYDKLNDNNVNNVHLVDLPSVMEIMWLIANSSLYIGTSLHGIITAMSFGVPYVGLNKSQVKLKGYVETWGLSGLDQIQDCNNFYDYANKCLQVPSDEIKMHSDKEKDLYYQHISQIIDLID